MTLCPECDYRFTDDKKGKVKCPECYTPLLITLNNLTNEVKVKSTEKPKQWGLPTKCEDGKQRTFLIKKTFTPHPEGYQHVPEPVIPSQTICLRCKKGVSLLIATECRVCVGYGKRVVKDIIQLPPPTNELVETEELLSFPLIKKGLVCQECFNYYLNMQTRLWKKALLDHKAGLLNEDAYLAKYASISRLCDVVPNWDNNQHRLALQEDQSTFGFTYREHDDTVVKGKKRGQSFRHTRSDPSWMTSRGKPSKRRFDE